MAAGLDLVARKSLERSSEASILIASSPFLAAHLNKDIQSEHDLWSWKHLKNQFCMKNAEPLFFKYQSRLQHTFFMIALMVNIISGFVAIIILWHLADIPIDDLKLVLTVKCVNLCINLAIYILSYKESWFLSVRAKLLSSILLTIIITSSEVCVSLISLVHGEDKGFRFMSYPLLVVSVFLPYPKWYQIIVATASLVTLEIAIASVGFRGDASLYWRQITADVLHHLALGALGLYMRFLIEFTNRKAFLDRRECFENMFHLQYEKEQEERLLLSVLPKHISVQVRDGIREVIRRLNQDPVPQRPFTELFVEKHRSVSILYADIVNSVALTASLSVSDLVETLNELFGRFDDSAERNSCLRIKLLGDCYYCVSGVPDEDPLHADHCVQMGLDIIEIIRDFREDSRVNVDMRIGVHSGNVLSGLLGLRKWQFDIWSRDVSIASRMEQSGRPGCVHITRSTKDLLKGKYLIEPGNGNIRDEYLSKYNTETFFIMPAKKQQVRRDNLYLAVDRTPTYARRQSASRLLRRQSTVTEVLTTRRRTVLGFSLLQFRLMLSQVNEFMESAIDGMALSKKDQWLHSEGIQPFFLTFRDSLMEKPFLKQSDPLFKYSLLGVLFTTFILTLITAFTKSRMNYFWIPCSLTFLICIICLFAFWISFIWTKLMKSFELPFIKVFQLSAGNAIIYAITFLVLSVMMILLALMGIEECESKSGIVSVINTTTAINVEHVACVHPIYFTWCSILSMTCVSLFLRIHFLMKLAVSGGFLALYSYLVRSHPQLFSESQLQDWNGLPAGLDQCWCLGVIWFLLHLLDRQVEYIGRLDYLWKRKLRLEQQEASLMGIVNKTLLRNILPEHVAKYYLNKESIHLDLDLYHEEYTSVAVMFASIPNYTDFYSESMLNDEGRKCLQVLHEIICDFDKLLYEPQFLKLEKIKTIGSTYMAAAGLQPGRNSSRTSYESFEPKEDPNQNVIVMTRFALAMIDTLNELNRHAWQDFKLRIGIAVGPVLAGVVGASKPQYDIWGDTVNIASRMDTTGVIGQIQVTEPVAEILQENKKYECECRGKIFVKGKGWMTTYLLQIPEETKL